MRYSDDEVLHGIDLGPSEVRCAQSSDRTALARRPWSRSTKGYRTRTGGTGSVLGVHPTHPTRAWRSRIGIVLQTCEMPAALTVWELVERFADWVYRQIFPPAQILMTTALGTVEPATQLGLDRSAANRRR